MSKQVTTGLALEGPPLGNRGHSPDEPPCAILVDTLLLYLVVAPILAAYALTEWLCWSRSLLPPPCSATVVALLGVIYSIYAVVTIGARRRAWKRWQDGQAPGGPPGDANVSV